MDGTLLVNQAYESFAGDLRRYVAKRTRDTDAAEDIVQEAFVRLQAESRAGRSPSNLRAWLYRVSLNLVIARARRSETVRKKAYRIAAEGVAQSPEVLFMESERDRAVRAAIRIAGSVGATSLLLAAEGYTGREIGLLIGRSEGATRTLMCRARAVIRRELADGDAPLDRCPASGDVHVCLQEQTAATT